MAMAIGMTMNEQHKLGLTLDGQVGKDLFSIPTSMPGLTNGAGVGNVTFSDPTMSSGFTHVSNCSAVSRPSSMAAPFSVPPVL